MARLKVDLELGFKNLEIFTKGLVNTAFLGSYKSVFKGRGLEFASYRHFTQDDDASMIDWKASARSGDLLIKEFMEERNLDVFFLINSSNSMALSSIPKLKCEYAAEFVSSLSYAMLKAGDNVGYAMFNENVTKATKPAGGMNQFYVFSEGLTNSENYGGNENFTTALKFIADFLKEKTLVFIVSDFIGLEAGWEKELETLSHKFDIIGVMVRDPIDKRIPPGLGQLAIIDPYSDERILLEPGKMGKEYEEETRREEQMIAGAFESNRCDFVNLTTTDSFREPLIELFRKRAKRWR
jgi:uncharacterized protein (DUF58 family)